MRRAKASLCMVGVTLAAALLMACATGDGRVPVETALIARGGVLQTLTLTGRAMPAGENACPCLTGGLVAQVYVEEGQRVAAGDALFRLSGAAQEAAVEHAVRALAEARAQEARVAGVMGAEASALDAVVASASDVLALSASSASASALDALTLLSSSESDALALSASASDALALSASASISASAPDARVTAALTAARETTLSLLRARTMACEAALQAATAAADALTCRATVSGVVLQVAAREGAYLPVGAAGALLYSGGMEVRAAALLSDAARVETGMRATLTTPDGARIPAVVAGVGLPAADAATGALTREVRFRVTDTGVSTSAPAAPAATAFSVGERVSAEIALLSLSDVPVAPVTAFTADGALWLVEEGRARRVPDAAGVSDGRGARVGEEWLGARIIIAPNSALSEGCAVREKRGR